MTDPTLTDEQRAEWKRQVANCTPAWTRSGETILAIDAELRRLEARVAAQDAELVALREERRRGVDTASEPPLSEEQRAEWDSWIKTRRHYPWSSLSQNVTAVAERLAWLEARVVEQNGEIVALREENHRQSVQLNPDRLSSPTMEHHRHDWMAYANANGMMGVYDTERLMRMTYAAAWFKRDLVDKNERAALAPSPDATPSKEAP